MKQCGASGRKWALKGEESQEAGLSGVQVVSIYLEGWSLQSWASRLLVDKAQETPKMPLKVLSFPVCSEWDADMVTIDTMEVGRQGSKTVPPPGPSPPGLCPGELNRMILHAWSTVTCNMA